MPVGNIRYKAYKYSLIAFSLNSMHPHQIIKPHFKPECPLMEYGFELLVEFV